MAERVLVELPGMKYACYFPNLESLLRYSIASFLNTFSVSADPDSDVAEFRHLFARVLNAYPEDPPLEAVWFFSALKFHDARDNVRYILDLISAFTASSPAAAKPLALLAPLVSGLFHSDKPRGKVERLVGAVLRYIIWICSGRPAGGEVDADDAGTLLPVFPELVKAWIPRGSSGSCPFEVLFPLAGDEARRELIKEGCTVTFLAGVVVAEAFLFRLYLKVQGAAGVPRSELQKGLITWAISSIQGFKNQEFFGVLLNMLVNPPLPVYSPLSADDEILVRDVLYYALILSDAEVDQADSSLFPIFVSRLVITFDAISDARNKGDHGRAKSYISAFSTSNIPSYLTSWAISRAGTKQLDKPTATTPQAFLKWLVVLEDKGFEVFGEKCSRIKKMLVHDEGQNDNQSRISQSDDGFLIHKQSHQDGMDTEGGEDEAVEMETADNAPMAAAHSVKVMANVTRKRKDCGTEDTRVVNIVKYKAKDSSVKDYLQATNGMSNGREVENLQSNDKMDETV